jgi:SAM-dependent methyltransferase
MQMHSAYVKCTLCSNPGTFERAAEVGRVLGHVRRHRDKVFTVWRCMGCASLHSLEPVDLQRYYDGYPIHRTELDFVLRLVYKDRIRLLKRLGCTRNSRLLDYGCGSGAFVQYLREVGFTHAAGYDPFVPAFADATLVDEKHDFVVSYDVIEHADDPREFIRLVASLLNAGGVLVLSTPNADGVSLQPGTVSEMELSQPYHRHILSSGALIQIAAEADLLLQRRLERSHFDTVVPGISTAFMWNYIMSRSGELDEILNPPTVRAFIEKPKLLWSALFGYFHSGRRNMVMGFRKVPNIRAAQPPCSVPKPNG